MATKEGEYIAELFKIAGFASLAPFGKLTLGIPYFELDHITIESLLYLVLTLSFAIFGIVLLYKGTELMRDI